MPECAIGFFLGGGVHSGEHKLHSCAYILPLAEQENKFLNNKIKLEKF